MRCSVEAIGSRRADSSCRYFFEVEDRLACDARIHCRARHRHRHRRYQAWVEGHGDDVVRAEARPVALIGGRDVVGHVLARQLGQRMGGGDLHVLVDGGCPHIQRAAEDVGEAEHVVDLVGIVRAARRHDRVIADFGRPLPA